MTDAFTVLRTPPPAVTPTVAAGLLRDQYNISGTLELQLSERDQNFLVQTETAESFVLKIANSAEAPEVTEFQAASLLHIRESDPTLPVPRVIETVAGETQVRIVGKDGRTHLARVLSWLDGVPLTRAPDSPNIEQHLGAILARLGVALQGFEHPASDYTLLWDIKSAGSLIEWLGNIKDEALRGICQQRLWKFTEQTEPALKKLRMQVIHNDLNLGNVLVDPQQTESITGIIDFGDIVRSPLIIDVAVAAAYLYQDSSMPLAGIEKFLRGYAQVKSLREEEIELLPDLIMLRNVTTIVIGNWRATQYPQNREYILRSEPLARKTIERLMSMDQSKVVDVFAAACQL